MTTEQKAKAYDEALKWMRKVYPTITGADKEDAEHYFPKLKESENERIRKAILEFFKLQDDNTTYSFIPKKSILAWLEKQKEQAVYKNSKSEIDFADKYSHDVWEKLMSKFDSIEGYSIGCNDVSDIVLNAVLNAFKWKKEQKASINIDQLKSMMLQYLLEVSNEKDDSAIEADTDKWARMILRYDFEQKPAEWSEEDEEMFDEALTGILLAKNRMNDTGCIGLAERFEKAYKWLESFRPRLNWKPSEEQMEALSETIAFAPDTFKPKCTLVTLQDDLKNL